MSKFAWVTLTTNDTYSLGALVLAHSLRRAGTQHQLAVLVTPGVSESMRDKLRDVYNVVQEVNVMDSQDSANLALLARPELGITFTKLHCWRLVQFEKCVFLDSDTLVLQNCDELFEREEFSAAPDVSWPDCFNSGVFVYKPSQETFDKIVEFALKNGSFDGGDQGLLNQYFADWATSDIKKRLPFLYNVTAYASYCYLPAFKQFRDKIKILHFAGKMKPWLIHYNAQSKTPSVPSDYAHAADLIQFWWNIFFDNVHSKLNDNMRYILPSYMGWKSNYDNMIQQQQQQYYEQQHYIEQQEQYNQQYQHYQENYTQEKVEFHDPWEDFYKKEESREQDMQTNGNEYQEQQYEEYQEQQQYQEHYQEENNWNQHETEMSQDYQYQQEQEYYEAADQQDHDDHYYDNQENNYEDHQQHHEHYYEQHNEQHHEQYNEQHHEQHNEQHQEYRVEESRDESANRDDSKNFVKTTTSDVKENDNKKQEVTKFGTKSLAQEEDKRFKRSSSIIRTHKRYEKPYKIKNYLISPSPSSSTSSITSLKRQEVNNVKDEKTEKKDKEETKEEEAGLAGALSHLRLGEASSPEQEAYEQLMRRQCWESGQVDYSGRDSFDNIWRKISLTLETKPDTGSS